MKNPYQSNKQNISLIFANFNNGRYLGDFLHSREVSSILPNKAGGSVLSTLEYGGTKEIIKHRKEYFGREICRFQVFLSYLHLKFYWQFLAADNFLKWVWLFLAAAPNPPEIIKKFTRR